MELSKEISNSLIKYFNRLSNFGYIPYNEVYSILATIAIKDLMDKYLLSERQYRLVEEALNCIRGTTCLIPYSEYIKQHSILSNDIEALVRLSEASDSRSTEDDIIRLMQ